MLSWFRRAPAPSAAAPTAFAEDFLASVVRTAIACGESTTFTVPAGAGGTLTVDPAATLRADPSLAVATVLNHVVNSMVHENLETHIQLQEAQPLVETTLFYLCAPSLLAELVDAGLPATSPMLHYWGDMVPVTAHIVDPAAVAARIETARRLARELISLSHRAPEANNLLTGFLRALWEGTTAFAYTGKPHILKTMSPLYIIYVRDIWAGIAKALPSNGGTLP